MNLKSRLILEDYRKQRENFLRLEAVVQGILDGIVKDLGILPPSVEHRVKTEQSLAGKLERKGDIYSSLDDITDILGCRIICFFSDEIDKIGKMVEDFFLIDRENSTDKRAIIKDDTFGYLSLHYICSLPEDGGYPEELCGKKFEIQIRTILQHAWSSMNHDIGYKSDFGVPRSIKRQIARLAGLFELADDEFVRLRDNMHRYSDEIRDRISEDEAGDISINMISLREYLKRSPKMHGLIKRIADIANAEIQEIDPEGYIPQLAFLGITTLGDIDTMIDSSGELALSLAEKALSDAQLDIVSSSIALRFLCRAELLNKDYDCEQITEFLLLSLRDEAKARRQARYLLSQKEGC